MSSSPASVLYGFLDGRTAKFFRGLCIFGGVYGIGGDYYTMRYGQLFPPEEATEYVVDCSVIGLPGPSVYNLPDLLYGNITPWAPVNGDVVLGRIPPAHPQFVQLIGGRFIERESCGIETVIPKERYEEVVQLRKAREAAIPKGQDELALLALESNSRSQLPDRR